jgi:hypothetical protein
MNLVEAAGVEHEIGDFSAVFQLIDGARVVVATRSWFAA